MPAVGWLIMAIIVAGHLSLIWLLLSEPADGLATAPASTRKQTAYVARHAVHGG